MKIQMGIFSVNGSLTLHQSRGMETPCFSNGEEMPPPSFELVSIFNLSLCYNFGKALHFFWRQQLSVPYQLRIEGCRE